MDYVIRHTAQLPELESPWEDPVWEQAETGVLKYFLEGSTFRPDVRFRVLYTDSAFYGMFRVEDEYVRSANTTDQQMICNDSCVEFFVRPKTGKGYLNFEFNCGGLLHTSHIIDQTRIYEPEDTFADFHMLTVEQCGMVNRFATLPRINDPERTGKRVWRVAFSIPFALFQQEFGQEKPSSGDVWTGNFYKCGDETSHPHWGMWKPVPEPNFHLMEHFGNLHFA